MWLFDAGKPLHTLVVSYLHPCEAALYLRLEPSTHAPHAERDDAKFLMFWLDNLTVLSRNVTNIEDGNFVLVAMAQQGNLVGMRYAKEMFGATLWQDAAKAASRMGHPECLRFATVALKERPAYGTNSGLHRCTPNLGRELYLAAFASQNEKGSIECLRYITSKLLISNNTEYSQDLEDRIAIQTLSWEEILDAGRSIHNRFGFETIDAACIAAARSGSVAKFDHAYSIATASSQYQLNDNVYSAILDAAAFAGNLAILKRLRQHDSHFRHPGMVSYGHVASVAAIRGHLECAKWAIEVAGPHANHYENRIFQHGAQAGSIECMELALELERPNMLHVSMWFINAESPRALECIHRLCSHRLTINDYAQTMWQAVRYPKKADNILVLARWLDVVETGLADGFLRMAAKFNRIAALHHLKTIGAVRFSTLFSAIAMATTEAANILGIWFRTEPKSKPSKPSKSQPLQLGSTFWKYGFIG